MRLGKPNRLLAVISVATRPSMDRQILEHHRRGIKLDRPHSRHNDQLPTRLQTTNQGTERLAVGRRRDSQSRAAQLLQPSSNVLGSTVDVLVRAQLQGKSALIRASRNGRDSVAHGAGVLHRHVAQPAESLDGHQVALLDVHLADAVEDGDAGAEKGRHLGRVQVGRHAHGGFFAEDAVLGVAAVEAAPVYGLVVARLELASLAGAARSVVACVWGVVLVWGDLIIDLIRKVRRGRELGVLGRKT